MSIIVGRPINGISINGLEYLLNDDNSEMTFNSIDEATQFLNENGISQECIDEGSVVLVDADTKEPI
jgi:hypothetical protein